jgi:hypothetical protein
MGDKIIAITGVTCEVSGRIARQLLQKDVFWQDI